MKNKLLKEKGILSLEACITVTIFLFMMLFMYSFFAIYEVRNIMAHTVLSTANSLSLDAHANDTINNTETFAGTLSQIFGSVTNDANLFVDARKWYNNPTQTDADGNEVISATLEDAIRQRFIAYLSGDQAGIEGKAAADKVLKKYHVKDGIDGLDFSGSYISDDNLYVKVRYTVEYEFNAFNLGLIEFEQSACSKIWKE